MSNDTEATLAELKITTVETWLKANGWYRLFWHRDGGTEWRKERNAVPFGASIEWAFTYAITVPDEPGIDAKRALIAELTRWCPAGDGSANAMLAELLRIQREPKVEVEEKVPEHLRARMASRIRHDDLLILDELEPTQEAGNGKR